ncbi:hypothetical protein P879_03364 [Paragonimus westermani]|uniref:Heat shock 70kDa protein 1/2/6/8 n=1 Tax=Paragonimus westermani TaxID=34504 RepID=A0A8T0D394_9TREM|nr:hypothetical protein P879_03364 [Paragonimus westermani]
MPVIGIDLGTSNCCVAVALGNEVKVIANELGNRTTPSYVAFTENEKLVGEVAKEQLLLNPKNTVFEIKRLIGSYIHDPSIVRCCRSWPFELVDKDGLPGIKVTYKGIERIFTPTVISSIILSYLRRISESYLEQPVKDAVITVPAYFNDGQRRATKEAGVLAGLNVLRVINEPVAAAIAYGLELEDSRDVNVLVYDLGGGTFDVSVLKVVDRIFEVKATTGDTHLGGEDFVKRMVEHFVKKMKNESNVNISNNLSAIFRLRAACEKAKKDLSYSLTADISLENIQDNFDFNCVISRQFFEHLNADLFQRTMQMVEQVLRESYMSKSQIHEIILTGGSTRIPIIQKMLSTYFHRTELNKSINPDEAIAKGAAAYATRFNDAIGHGDIVLRDVVPLSLGTMDQNGIMRVIIPKNTPIPCQAYRLVTTTADHQKNMEFTIWEGEKPQAQENHFLNAFRLENITDATRGVPTVRLTFEVNEEGMLTVSAKDDDNGTEQRLVIDPKASCANRPGRFRSGRAPGSKERTLAQRREDLIQFAQSLIGTIDETENSEALDFCAIHCRETIRWVEDHPNSTLQELKHRRLLLQKACRPLFETLSNWSER